MDVNFSASSVTSSGPLGIWELDKINIWARWKCVHRQSIQKGSWSWWPGVRNVRWRLLWLWRGEVGWWYPGLVVGLFWALGVCWVLGNVASNWVREGEEGGGVLPPASETRVYTLSTEMLSSQWNFKTLQALTSPTGLGENVCLKQVKSEKRTGMDGPLYRYGHGGDCWNTSCEAWVTLYYHWYPENLNVWFIGKQNYGRYLVTWHCSQFPISSLDSQSAQWPRSRSLLWSSDLHIRDIYCQ